MVIVERDNRILNKEYKYDERSNQLNVTIDSGFFSLCTITLRALTRIYPSDKYVMVNWPAQNQWRDNNQSGVNLFELYFNPNKNIDTNCFVKVPSIGQYHIYEDLNFKKLNLYVQKYFVPSGIVRSKKEEFVRKYGIDYGNTIGLSYRATDKWFEIAQIQPGYYVREAKHLLSKNPNLRVLLQTDQQQVRDFCVQELGDRVFYLSEMPVTNSTIGIHNISEAERGVSNFELGIRLLAAVNILAECKYSISHSGSVGLWTYLFRGTPRNACQLRPGAPDIFSRYDGEVGIRRATLKLARKLIIND